MATVTRATVCACVAAGIVAASSWETKAAFVWTMVEQGGNVVVNGSGSLNLTDLTDLANFPAASAISPSDGIIAVNASGFTSYVTGDITTSISGPSSFGNGLPVTASTSSGDNVSISTVFNYIGVPFTYLDNEPLSNTMTFIGASFASLGVNPGSYVWRWGTGVNVDTLTLDIVVTAAVPEPGSSLLLGAGLLGLVAVRRRRSAG